MFNKENHSEKMKEAETIIGPSIKVSGNFVGQGNIIIEGSLEGFLKTSANLFVGDEAIIKANVEADEAIINGEVTGDIKVNKYLAIGRTAKINGNVEYGEISIERGAKVNGQIKIITTGRNLKEDKTPKEQE